MPGRIARPTIVTPPYKCKISPPEGATQCKRHRQGLTDAKLGKKNMHGKEAQLASTGPQLPYQNSVHGTFASSNPLYPESLERVIGRPSSEGIANLSRIPQHLLVRTIPGRCQLKFQKAHTCHSPVATHAGTGTGTGTKWQPKPPTLS